MIRIGQIGDLHITDGPRFRDTARCIDAAIDDGNKQGVQLWLVGGDLTGTTVPHESFLTERNYLDEAIQAMASQAPVVIIRGNHDLPDDIAGYGRLYGDCPIYLVNKLDWLTVDVGGQPVQLVCLPYPDKASLIEIGAGSIKDDNRAAADALRAKLRALKGRLDPTRPIILMAHINIAGCQLAGGEVLADKEVELWRDDLVEFDADWTALSHIHLQQEITPKAWYAGSPSAQDFGAIDEKGYLIVDIDPSRERLPIVHRRVTPSRKMVSVAADWRRDESGNFGWQIEDAEIPAGAEVRVQVRLPEAELAACPTDQLAALMEAKGAHAVTVDRRVLPTNRVRSEAIASANTTADRVRAYWQSQDGTAPEPEQQSRCLEKLSVLETEAGKRADGAGGAVLDALVLHKLRCKGAGDTIRNEVEIDFDALGDGITCIVGENGSGKSHLIDLAGMGTWFGEYTYYEAPFLKHVPRGMRDAFSDLVWSSGGHTYRALVKADTEFSGGKGKTEGYLWRDDEPLAGSGKITDYATAIAAVIPDRTLLLASVVASQGNAGNFFDLKKAERKDMFMRALRLEHLQVESVAAGRRTEESLAFLESMRREIARLEASLERAVTLRAELAAALETATRTKESIEQARRAVVDAEGGLKAASDQLVGIQAAADARRAERGRLEAEASTVQSDLDKAVADIAQLAMVATDLEAAQAAAAEVATLDTRLDDLRAKERKLAEDLRPLDTEIATSNERLKSLRAEAQRLLTELKSCDASLEALANQGELERAEREASDKLVETDEQITANELLLERLRIDADAEEQVEQRRGLIKGKLDALRPQASTLGDVDTKHPMCAACPAIASARTAADTIEDLEREQAELPAAPTTPTRTKIAPTEQMLKTLRTAREDWQRKQSAARTALAALDGHRQNDARRAGLNAQLEAVRGEGQPLATRVTDLEAAKEQLERQIAQQANVRGQVEQIRTQHAQQAAKLPQLMADCARRDEILAAKAKLEARAQELAGQIAELADIDLSSLQAVVDAAQATVATHRATVTHLEAALRSAEDEGARFAGELRALGDPETELTAQKAAETEVVTEISDWRVLERALGRDGVQALCLDQAGPVVSRYCNELLQSCFDSRFTLEVITARPKADGKGMVEVFEVRLIDAESGAREKGSGGEMVLVNEALRLAISIWNVQQSGYQIRTLWRDEAAEGLSERNQDRYVQMLRRARQLGGFQRVLLIAHSHRVWAQADSHIFVAPAKGTRPTRLFTDQQAWREHLAGDVQPVETAAEAA